MALVCAAKSEGLEVLDPEIVPAADIPLFLGRVMIRCSLWMEDKQPFAAGQKRGQEQKRGVGVRLAYASG